MAKKSPKRPSDPISLAKAIGDIATGQANDIKPTDDEVSRVMSMLGKIGGLKGGIKRAEKLTKKRRQEIAKKAAKTRWDKRKT